MENTDSTLFDKIFRDSNCNIVIAQAPNPPLILWVVAGLLSLIIPSGTLNTVFQILANGALFTWAWLELFQGVNYFRRALGLVVLIGLIAFQIQNL
ncbi:hypothetical protein [Nostoc sp. FACHB-280]|uniref:hypothetical protein n=1 Tax=Nostoc sp. FACHB-280 TaxID=2692839 RepID=UPI00168A99BD|nr:hypothetical protein [Nostoc sp. FACHB-280]MBD2493301.1 hypothetical protein [Nostoc sp. FACHB-280]